MLEYSPQAKTMEDKSTTKHEGVPYYSQSLDCLDKDGNIDKFWFRRSCGMACVKMALDYFTEGGNKTLVEMADEGKNKGGYSESGWRHDYFVTLFKENGLQAFREEKMDFVEGTTKIAFHIESGGLVIASCIVPFMGEKDFHMILIKGVHWKDDGKTAPIGFYYSDPDSLYRDKAEEKYVDMSVFLDYWRKMAIFVSK